jgi:hypothetical protein
MKNHDALWVHSTALALQRATPSSSPIRFSSSNHFLKNALQNELRGVGQQPSSHSLRLVTGHFLRQDSVEQISGQRQAIAKL